MPPIKRRPFRISPQQFSAQWHPMVREIYASRVGDVTEVNKSLQSLAPPTGLPDLETAVARLVRAIEAQESICVYGDYDVDGATATALMVRVLRRLGAKVGYFVPNRQAHGYGLSVAGLQALKTRPDLVLTVDNRIRSHAAAMYLQAERIDLIITDHHEPDNQLPPAVAVINPKRVDSHFASPNLAGVGVAFYLLLALRRYYVDAGKEFLCQLTDYLDLVALGTVADVVPLDFNNRILVQYGIARLQAGQGNIGVRALCAVANVELAHLNTGDFGFAIAPRLNAVGRLEDMSDGVALLLSNEWATAQEYAQMLDDLNRERKAIENEMTHLAVKVVNPEDYIASAYLEDGHEGVIGIVASRLKSKFSRPALVATCTADGEKIKASLRSVIGVDIHQLLAETAKNLPAEAMQFGGHTMAAGLTVAKPYYQQMIHGLNQAFQQSVGTEIPQQPLYVDGALTPDLFHVDWARFLEKLEPWGTDLPAPTFHNTFQVVDCRCLGAQHTRLTLRHPETGQQLPATWFFHQADFHYGEQIEVVYQIQLNRFFADERLNLLISYAKRIS